MAILMIDSRQKEVPSLIGDLILTSAEACALYEIAHDDLADFISAFGRYGTTKRSIRDAVLKRLSKDNYVKGNIDGGKVSWELKPSGKAAVMAIEEMIGVILTEVEEKKKRLAGVDFDDRVRAGYYSIDSDTAKEFADDLFEYFGVTKNPRAGKAYALAYEYGHSGGYNEVVSYFRDLVELIT